MTNAKIMILTFLAMAVFAMFFSKITFSYDSLDTESIDISLDISFELWPQPTLESSIKELSALIYLYPEDSQYQTIKSIDYYPKEALQGHLAPLNFSIENPVVSNYTFGYSARLEKSRVFKKIKTKISYPFEGDLPNYISPTKILDYEDYTINEVATSLAKGQTDYSQLVYDTAIWVKENIQYKKTPKTESSQLPASWVMYNRYGVCDEISAIFAALLRAQGIPSRIVSGIAYSESIEETGFKNWGLHAWTEAYIPEYGWVPFDIAFDQYFGVDASHISLMYYDNEKSSFEYSWRSKNTKFESSEINFNVDFIGDSTEQSEDEIGYTLSPKYLLVGFGSYNQLDILIENYKDYYVPISLQVSMPGDVIILTPQKSHILIKPKEKIKLSYIVKFPHALDPGYVYSYPINVYSKSELKATQTISVSPKFESYALDNFETQKSKEQEVKIGCIPQSKQAVVGKSAGFKCFVYNNGFELLKDRICLDKTCYPFEIEPNDFLAFDFKKTFTEPKTQEINFTLTDRSTTLLLDIYDTAQIEISNLTITDPSLSDELLLSAIVSPKSSSPVLNLSVYIYLDEKVLSEWHEEQLMIPSVFGVNIQKYLLKENSSKVGVYVEYYDVLGDKLSKREIYYTPAFQRSFFEKVYAFVMNAGHSIENIFKKVDTSYNKILGAFLEENWEYYKVFKS